jgi:hypothetical protein
MKHTTAKMSVLTMPLFLVSIACAQAFTYNQSFDALPTSGAATDITGTGAVTNQGALVAISTTGAAWQAARILGSGSTVVKLNVDTGSLSSGSIFSYGASASTNRSLGSLASGTTAPAFGVGLTNTTGSILGTVTITFKAQQWRSPSNSTATSLGVVNTLTFAHGLASNGITNDKFLSATTMTPNVNGNVVSNPTSGTTAAVGLVELSTNTVTLTGLTWNNGDVLYLRWQDVNDAANDAGLAIDDLAIIADIAGENTCPSDLDGSRNVDSGDVSLVLLDVGPCQGCAADLDGSGDVDSGDVSMVLLESGPCP